MEREAKKRYPFKGPSFRVTSGYNQRFFSEVNANLDKLQLTNMDERDREYYLARYGRINVDFDYLSPIYFASAVAFLNDHKGGPKKSNFNEKAIEKYVKPIISDIPSTIPASTLNLRRKIEFLRYIRLLIKIENMYYPSGAPRPGAVEEGIEEAVEPEVEPSRSVRKESESSEEEREEEREEEQEKEREEEREEEQEKEREGIKSKKKTEKAKKSPEIEFVISPKPKKKPVKLKKLTFFDE